MSDCRAHGERRDEPRPARPAASGAVAYLLAARALRDFGDGFVAVLLPVYLITLGFSPLEIGAIATSALLGSALLTLGIGLIGARHDRQRLLLAGASPYAPRPAGDPPDDPGVAGGDDDIRPSGPRGLPGQYPHRRRRRAARFRGRRPRLAPPLPPRAPRTSVWAPHPAHRPDRHRRQPDGAAGLVFRGAGRPGGRANPADRGRRGNR